MPADAPNDFVAFLRREAGDALRSVIYYDGQDHELAYVRDDVAAAYSSAGRNRVIEALLAEAAARADEEDLYVHGDLNCIVKSFEHAVELHFPEGTYRGTAVALDAAVATEQAGVIAEIIKRAAASGGTDEPERGA